MVAALATSGASIASRMPVTLGVVETIRAGFGSPAAARVANRLRARASNGRAERRRVGMKAVFAVGKPGGRIHMIMLLMQSIP